MTIRDDRREAAIDRMADHIVAHGLGSASLRALARTAGTSDRMLLYYFRDKEELLAATLGRIAERLLGQLDAALPATPARPFARLLDEVWHALSASAAQPAMHLWLEIASGAARGEMMYRTLAGPIADGFLAWVATRLAVGPGQDHARMSALLLATVEGLLVLEAVGRRTMSETAVAAARDLA